MLASDLVYISFHNLLLHKIRSFLTSLGIIFGVGSVIAMLAISGGAKQQALAQIEAMGVDNIIINSKRPSIAGKDESDATQNSIMECYGLTNVDRSHIRGMDNVHDVCGLRDARQKITRGVKRLDLILVSTTPNFLEMTNSNLVKGRWLNNVDSRNQATVCVIGRNVKRKMFSLGTGNIVGQTLRAQTGLFRIVGVIENDVGTEIPGLGTPNNMIFISEGTGAAMFTNTSFQQEGRSEVRITQIDYDVLIVQVTDTEHIDHTARRIERYLTKSHDKEKDWGMFVPLDLLKQKERTQNIFTVVMASIAGISLIVGGVGIMNIMLANVYERRREIGTRRALGAKKNDILSQFLIETVFLTSIGGLVGVGAGVAIAAAVGRYAEWPITFSSWSVILSLGIASGVGVLFGTYPAWKAAQQNPIDVLRSE